VGRLARLLIGVALLVASTSAVGCRDADGEDAGTGAPRPAASSSVSTASTTTTAVVPVTVATTAPAPPSRYTMDPYHGLGAWIDVFDWSATYDRSAEDPPTVGLDDIDAMASLGVRTLYLQPARWDSPVPGVVDPDLARAIIDRAHGDGMAVVGWYLPTLVDPAADRAQIAAVRDLPLDGFGLDIESVLLADEAERNARVVQLAADLRAANPDDVLSAIVLPPVVTEVYGTYWAGFPWAELAPYFDVWQPMGYWTNRTVESGWRDAYTYTASNIDLLRQATGRPDAVVHPVGGIGCCEGPTAPSTPADIEAMLRAAAERGAPGASIYDFATTGPELWPALAGANGLG
jgi:hypothetical protein